MYNITDLNLQIASKHPVVTYLHISTQVTPCRGATLSGLLHIYSCLCNWRGAVQLCRGFLTLHCTQGNGFVGTFLIAE